MAMNQPSERLACGTDLETLNDHLAAATLDDHERNCPHCQRAVGELTPVRRATDLMRAEPAEPPAGFIDAIMSRIRTDPRRSRQLRLPADPPLRLSISEHAATAVLAIAAETVPGVRVRRCRFPDSSDDHLVNISISLRYATSAPETASRIRRVVRAAARDQLGLDLHAVDIDVDDVHDAP